MNNLKSIEELQGIISRAIEEVDLPLEPSELYNPIRYLLSIGGKHLRPILVLMTADMYQFDLTKVMPQALGVELFHNFTLMHDDIMDEAPIRRGRQPFMKSGMPMWQFFQVMFYLLKHIN